MKIQTLALKDLLQIKNKFLVQFRNNTVKQFNNISKDIQSEKEKIQVIYLGGSHIEQGILNSKSKIRNFSSFKISPISNEREFLSLLRQIINSKCNRIILSIAADLKSVKSEIGFDSILQTNHHLHNFSFLLDKKVGAWLSKNLGSKFTKKISVVNNLVSLSFGINNQTFSRPQTIIGIAATGVNLGYFEDNQTFVNLESGKLKIANQEVSELIGEEYLYKIFNKEAKKRGLKINLQSSTDFRNLLSLATSKNNLVASAISLSQSILKQSAQIYAAKIKALIDFRGLQADQVELVMEGSLFWEIGNYKEIVLETLETLGKSRTEIKLTKIRFGFILGSFKIFKFSPKTQRKVVLIIQELFTFFRNLNWSSLAPPQFGTV